MDFEPEHWLPVDGLRARDPKLKQGSKAENIADNDHVFGLVEDFTNHAVGFYKDLLALQVAPEIARTVLPQSMYSEFIETGSLSAYARICALRLDPSAQKEIRDYATMVSKLLETAFPVCWKALQPLIPAPAPAPKKLLATNSIETDEQSDRDIVINGDTVKITIRTGNPPVVEPVQTIDPVSLKKTDAQPHEYQWSC